MGSTKYIHNVMDHPVLHFLGKELSMSSTNLTSEPIIACAKLVLFLLEVDKQIEDGIL